MKLYFVRNLGHYVIQIYLPSSLVVILSWVSFWLDRTSAPARVSLGITTVLTMLTLIWSTNASLPKISYIKSIDVYLVFCFFMTFLSVIEYGTVSFVHRFTERQKKRLRFRQTMIDINNLDSATNQRLSADSPDLAIHYEFKYFKIDLKASSIDNYSRIIFPFVFFFFHVFYWSLYMIIAKNEGEKQKI